MNIRVTRLANGPIIGPHLHPSIGVNIQGPSLMLLTPNSARRPGGRATRSGRHHSPERSKARPGV